MRQLLSFLSAWVLGLVSWAHAGSVQLLEGTSVEGELSIDNGVLVRGERSARVPFASILRATFAQPKPEEYQPGLVLVNGSRIAGSFGPLMEPVVKVGAVSVPATEVAWAIYQPFGADLAAQIPRGKTGALLPGGDFFEGVVKSADGSTAKVLNSIFGPRVLDASRKDAHAIILRDTAPKAAAYEVQTANGSVFVALDISIRDPSAIILRHPLYDGLRVDVRELVEIRAAQSRYLALDSIKPTKIDVAAGKTPELSFAAGKMLDGSPLSLAGKPVRGVETAAGAVASWEMPAGAATFTVRVAASAGTPPAQKLIFTVYADGKALARSALLGAGDAPALLRCNLPAGAKLLSVRAEGIAGSGIWADPIVLRR